MKKAIIFTALFIFFSNVVISQQYLNALDSNSKWTCIKAEFGQDIPFELFIGDTNTNGSVNLYHIFSLTHDTTSSGVLWSSSDNSKLWFSISGFAVDSVLIMNLNLSIGDTFFFLPAINYYSIVDSVYWKGGRKIVRFEDYPSNYNEKYKFTEGVGPSFGLNYLVNFDTHTQFCTCKFISDSLIWNTSLSPYENCLISTIFNNQVKKYFIFPNPSSGLLHYSEDFINAEYSIINIFGEIVMRGMIAKTVLNINSLPEGLYVFLVKTENRTFNFKFQKA